MALPRNSPTKVRVATRLEGELGYTLLFDHGGGKSASSLWVACILLRFLFREWLALGRAVEVFTKHSRREAM